MVQASMSIEPSDAPEADEMEVSPAVVRMHPRADRSQHLRIIEAILFAAEAPVAIEKLQGFFPEGTDVPALLSDLQANYANRGVNLVQIAGHWALRTAEDLSFVLRRETFEQKRLSKAALETLAIVAYHEPVSRAEIEATMTAHSPISRMRFAACFDSGVTTWSFAGLAVCVAVAGDATDHCAGTWPGRRCGNVT